VYFYIVGEIKSVQTIATGRQILELRRLNRVYGKASWRKRKGIARIKLNDGTLLRAEVHWYEGHGKGKMEMKIKKYLE
jgi:hypothetical protein